MKRTLHQVVCTRAVVAPVAAVLLLFSFSLGSANAANRVWDGGGANVKWSNPANWVGGAPPNGTTDSVTFTGTVRPSNSNDLSGATFTGIAISSPAGVFTLSGLAANLNGGISDNQGFLTETINLPITLAASENVDVAANGILTIKQPISGTGFGPTMVDAGQVNLGATNVFTGPLTINAGTVQAFTDLNLGAVPGAATPGLVVLDGGSLLATNTYTISAKRGIAVGAPGGVVVVTNDIINVSPAATLTYNGVIADNAGGPGGGLQKFGFGGLTLGASNTYSGPTAVENGTLTLSFSTAGAPLTNIIEPSALQLGGANSGSGATNFAQLTISPLAKTNTSQSFSSTLVTFGGSVIQVVSNLNATNILNLGSLTHQPGGTVIIVPPTASGITGLVSTATANVNGILGGWAGIGNGTNEFGIILATNLATVDANGFITNYNGYAVMINGTTVHASFNSPANNLLINTVSTGDVTVDADNANSWTDVNTISTRRGETGNPTAAQFTLQIGTGNTLRLGKYGTIFKQDTIGTVSFTLGQSANGANGQQDVGTLTAGGATNTPGEIVLNLNNSGQTSGGLLLDCLVTDNGTGPVTVVKTGGSTMKIRGHNTYTGGTYLLQGRFEMSGAEIGTVNNNACGTGPIYCLPGAYFFPAGTPAPAMTNALFIAGDGTSAEPLGATRGGTYLGPITLIGDANFGGNAVFASEISGPFNVIFGSQATINGGATLSNSLDNWTGNTTMTARNNTGANVITSGASEVIPDGLAAGNVTMIGFSTGTIEWNLNSFSETINGLSTSGTGTSCFIDNNNVLTSSTLTVGNNDQSGTFGGIIRDSATSGGGQMSFIKEGAGNETLTGTNTYSGRTQINGGTLALTGNGQMSASSSITVQSNGIFDVSGISGAYSTPGSIQMTNGTLSQNLILATSIPTLTMNNSGLSVTVSPLSNNVVASTVNLGGATNVVNILGVQGITGYPTTFNIITYSTLNGALNVGIGTTPNATTGGFVSNYAAGHVIQLVLTNGPKPIWWVGTNSVNPSYWDEDTTTNWLAFKGSPSQAPSGFDDGDPVTVDDTGSNAVISLQVNGMIPEALVVSNVNTNYTFTGPGNLTGLMGLTKQGTATATFINTGGDNYSGTVAVQGGTLVFGSDNFISGAANISPATTLQIGTNGGTGTLPGGLVDLEGNLIFDRNANLTVPNVIQGNSSTALLKKIDASSVLTLSGANTFTGAVEVAAGTLSIGSGSALGATNTGTLVDSGASLDVNGQVVGFEPISVSGTGAGGQGAIVNNSTTTQLNALRNVTLLNDTTIGGVSRWDIRETAANALNTQLSTGGNAYNLTKISTNQTSFVGTAIDSALNNININNGILGFETDTTGMGNPSATVTIAPTGQFEMFNTVNNLGKVWVFNGGTIATNLAVGAGTANAIQGNMTISGTNVWNIAAGAALTVNSQITGITGGGGGITLTGGGSLTLGANGAALSYTNSTIVLAGTLVLSSGNTAAVGVLSNAAGSTFMPGSVTYGSSVVIAGIISPGGTGLQGIFTIATNLTILTNATVAMDLGQSDQIIVNGNLSLLGTNTLAVNPELGQLSAGTEIQLITYAGTLTTNGVSASGQNVTNFFKLTNSLPGYTFYLTNDTTVSPPAIAIVVTHVPLNQTWKGGAPNAPNTWDTGDVTNWETLNNAPLVAYNTGDLVRFDDNGTTGSVIVSNNLPLTPAGGIEPNQVFFANSAAGVSYILSGPGNLQGPAQLIVGGGGHVIIANGGISNSYTGGTVIEASGSVLQLGNNDANGALGTGGITNVNASTLIFARNNTWTNPSVMAADGTFGQAIIQSNATEVTVLTGNLTNVFCPVIITNGTLRIQTANPFTNNSFGSFISIASGASLDIFTGTGNANLQTMAIDTSGAGTGVGGNGAIMNSSGATTTGPHFAYVQAGGDLTIGAFGRLDWRDSGATNANAAFLTSPQNSPYNLNIVGTNLCNLAGVQFDPAIANITVQHGILGIQGAMGVGFGGFQGGGGYSIPGPGLGNEFYSQTALGNPTNLLTVMSNATVQFFETSNELYKVMVLTNGAILNNSTGTNFWGGPIILAGANTNLFNIGGTWLEIDGQISGTNGFAKVTGGSPLILSSNETYTGPTYINTGLLILTNLTGVGGNPLNDASISNSPVITLNGGNVDPSALSTGALTIQPGQTLAVDQNAEIFGSLAVLGNSVIGVTNGSGTPAGSGTLTATNNVNLSGAVSTVMGIKAGTGSALVKTIGNATTITYGGVLTVTNAGTALKGGMSFQLFSSGGGSYLGSFTATNLPPLGPGLSYSNTLNTTGTIAVVGTLQGPTFAQPTYAGTTLTLTGAGGSPYAPYTLLSTTNITNSLSKWTKLVTTNKFTGTGSFSVSVLNATNTQQYFDISQ